MALVTQTITTHLQRNQSASNTGDQTGNVDLNSHFKMGDQANVTQLAIEDTKGPAVLLGTIVEKVGPTVMSQGALTSGNFLQEVVSRCAVLWEFSIQ